MAANRAAATSYVAAGVLAAITLFVFYTLRDYGPESAIRRFHDDFKNGNRRDLQEVTLQSIDAQSTGALERILQQFDAVGATSRIVDEDLSRPDRASVLAMYQLPFRNDFIVWIVRLDQNHSWRVDTDETLQAFLGTHPGVG